MSWSVYKHTCPDGKVYIGITSVPVEKRWLDGFGYEDQFFFKGIVKHGWDNIKHEVLFSDLSQEQALEKERELIEKYDSANFDRGYNVSPGFHAKENLTLIRKIFQIDLVTNEIVNSFDTIKEANETTGIPIMHISAAYRGMIESSGGYGWKKEKWFEKTL